MEAFSLAEKHPPMAGLTISSKINLQTSVNNVTCFSLGKGTSISAEAYDRDLCRRAGRRKTAAVPGRNISH